MYGGRRLTSFAEQVLENMKADFNSAEDLDGYEDLREEDQQRISAAFEAGEGKSFGGAESL